ncbi:alpha/beta-hydrolase [Schizopora paradoxa]|uniref:acylaminoacyl-peptidase n=1 Tax=Schizopora paradoxa TaxID=27342 RepID=A0A0H2R8S0_9AGAM|nr:alpha/beta-hydrolase [Schizopora paradoxa]
MTIVDSSELYCELSSIPSFSDARFITSDSATTTGDGDTGASTIRVTSSVVDHLRNTRRSLVKHIITTSSGSFITPAQDASDAVSSFVSSTGSLVAVLRETQGQNGEEKRFVEVWKENSLQAIADVTKIHGSFYTDAAFSSSSFSPSESALCYTAEENSPETEENDKSFDKMRFRPLMGETYKERKRPGIFIMRWGEEIYQAKKSKFSSKDIPSRIILSTLVKKLAHPVLPGAPVFGQAVFKSDTVLYATGYEKTSDDRFLGLYACGNRPSGIWAITLPTDDYEAVDDKGVQTIKVVSMKKISPDDQACRSPRIVKDKMLVWLSMERGGPHLSCSRLDSFDFDTGHARTLVDTVAEPLVLPDSLSPGIGQDLFCGLFVDQLPMQPLLVLDGESYILTHATCTHYNALYLIALSDGTVRRLHLDDGGVEYSWSILCTDSFNRFVCRRSKSNAPGELFLGTLTSLKSSPTLKFLDKPKLSPKLERLLSDVSIDVIYNPDPNLKHVETIVLRSSVHAEGEGPKPCIFMPHGGPHGAYTIDFSSMYISFVLAGYTLALPNYTGSLGYGEKNVKALIGKCGTLDVKDCVDAVDLLVQKGYANRGKGSLFVYGGSHGGFLAGHLIGQHPSIFSAAVMSNPVTAAGDMIATTDIPDWCYAEFGQEYPPPVVKDADGSVQSKLALYATLQEASPIAHVNAVQAPVLLLIGEQDQRVPPSQGKNYYHALRQRKKIADMLYFPGNGHSLEQVESSRLAFEAAVYWFGKFK